LQWVLGGRLIIATVLLGATMYLALDAIRYGRFTPTFLLILISAIYGSSILFGVLLLRGRRENLVATAITTLDVLLITGLVYLTGGAGSIFSFLYGAQILTAALTLGTSAAYYTAAASLACYFLQGLALNVGWLPPPPDQPLSQYVLSSRDFQRDEPGPASPTRRRAPRRGGGERGKAGTPERRHRPVDRIGCDHRRR
jgi:hypothetical protein